ncbi:unnamed protein product [Ixodes pacificus]
MDCTLMSRRHRRGEEQMHRKISSKTNERSSQLWITPRMVSDGISERVRVSGGGYQTGVRFPSCSVRGSIDKGNTSKGSVISPKDLIHERA